MQHLLGRRPFLATIFGLALLVCLALISEAQQLLFRGKGKDARFGGNPPVSPSTDDIHVCLCSDDTDLRPAFAAIHSAWISAAEPQRLVFHYITTPRLAPIAQDLFERHLPSIRIEVQHDAVLEAHITSTISFRESSKARKILASPFNFAPFYLHKYLTKGTTPGQTIKRAIYIDTDTLIMGDLRELHDVDMRGQACAAVSYCLQRFGDYLNFEQLKKLGYNYFDPKRCIANRGLIVVDFARWITTRMTDKIEHWMAMYRDAPDDLWWGGMSQPPWLLAMNGEYLELGDEWNCNSLGRETMSPFEFKTLRTAGFDKAAMVTLGVSIVWRGGARGAALPYVVTCSQRGKLLHYNGAMKPWARERWPADKMWPACALPEKYPNVNQDWTWNRTIKVYCNEQRFVACPDLWSYFITPEANSIMKTMGEQLQKQEAELQKTMQEEKEREAKMRAEAARAQAERERAEQEWRRREEESRRSEEQRRQEEDERRRREEEAMRPREREERAREEANAKMESAVSRVVEEAERVMQAVLGKGEQKEEEEEGDPKHILQMAARAAEMEPPVEPTP